MKPLDQWPLADRHGIAGVLTDIDDTLTTDGDITPDALKALHDLRRAGLPVVAITGRPAGWSEPFVTRWPVSAIVAENGAVALTPRLTRDDPDSNLGERNATPGFSKIYIQDAATRERNRVRMAAVVARLAVEVPEACLAQDSAGRETDIAIDHSEFTTLTAASIARVVAILKEEDMAATVSSIHINGWFGSHNKLVGARWILRELLNRELDSELDRWVYVGDSTNDALMFATIPNSVGVANIDRFAAQIPQLPRYVSRFARGAGFAEMARLLLAAR